MNRVESNRLVLLRYYFDRSKFEEIASMLAKFSFRVLRVPSRACAQGYLEMCFNSGSLNP